LINRKCQALLVLLFLLVFKLGASETKDGYIRMLIDEKTGRFELSFLTDPAKSKYSQLIYKNGNTSFLDININGMYYRLGESRDFETRVEVENEEPVVYYESDSLTVKMIFSPVKTVSSPNANGIRIRIRIINKSDEEPDVGLRMVIDTVLGEGRKNVPFITENINIKNEKIIESSSDEKYWISRGKDISLMGSIADPLDTRAKKPDYLHFANWKKLSDVPWKASYHEGRSFNKLPYSIGDSAVSYYWEPCFLGRGKTITYTVYLTTEDTEWYNLQPVASPVKQTVNPYIDESITDIIPEPAVVEQQERTTPTAFNMSFLENEARESSQRTGEDYNVVILRMLQNTLNRFIAGEISLSENDIHQIDLAIERHGQRQE